MLSAPAHIPAIRVASLGTGLAAPDLILDSTMRTFSPSNSARSVCSASVITGTSPAHDTRLSSSNTAESGVNLCDTCTESAFLCRSDCCCWNSNHPSSEGTFLIKTPAPSSIKLGGSRLSDLGVLVAVQPHVHLGQCPGCVVLLLAVDGDAARGLGGDFEQQRARATCRFVNSLVLASPSVDPDHLGEDPRHFCRGVELAFALARFSGEVAHQILVGVPEQVVALGAGAAEVEVVKDRHQAGQPVNHLLAFAQLLLVVEVRE